MLSPPIVPRSIATCLLFVLGSAVAQGGGKPGAEPKAETPLSQCAAANRQSLAELTQAFEAARNRNRLNPVMVSRLHSFEVQLGNLRAALPRDTRNLKSCEQLTQGIATELERLQKIAGPDPQVAECMAANQLAHGQALQAVAALPAEAQAVAQPMLARLNELRPGLTREGQTVQDCKQTSTAIIQERTQLVALAVAAAKPPVDSAAIDACRASNIDGYGEALRAWRDWASILGVAAGANAYDAAMVRLRRLRDEVARPVGSLADCEALTRSIAQERARAPRPGSAAAPEPARAPVAPAAAAPPPAPVPPAAGAVPTAPTAPTSPPPGRDAAPAPSPQPAVVSVQAPPAKPAPAAPVAGPTIEPSTSDCRTVHGAAYNDVARRFARVLEGGGPATSSPAMQALGERLTAMHAQLAAGASGSACAPIVAALQQADRDLAQLVGPSTPAASTPASGAPQ